MTTLGALLVGLVLLVVLLVVFAWMQRRSRRGPEQPRTVADLVRMREAVRPEADDAEAPAPPAEVVDPEPEPVEATEAPVVAPHGERSDEPEVVRARQPVSREDAAVEAPWARAARMVELGADASVVDEAPVAPRRPALALVPSGDSDGAPRSYWRSRPGSAPRLPTPETADPAPSAPRQGLRAASNGIPDHPTPSAAPTPEPAAPAPTIDAAAPAAAKVEAAAPASATVAAAAPAEAKAEAIAPAAAPDPADAAADEPAPTIDADAAAAPAEAKAETTAPAAAPDPADAAADEPAPPAEPAAPAAAAVEAAAPAPSTVDAAAPAAASVDPAAPGGAPAESRAAPSTSSSGVAPDAGGDAPRPTNGAGAEAPRPTNGHGPTPTPARVAGRVRRRPSATAAEQAAADLALLRTFGVAHRNGADEPDVALEGCTPEDDAPAAGNAQPVSFRVLGRDGHGIRAATVTLLDDHGRETASTRTDPDGHGVLTARHPGGFMLVIAAEGYQPGAITVAVTDGPVDAEIPLTRSASVTGSVVGEDGPVVGAQLALVQDGEIVDTAESTAEGAYRFADLAAGEYGLSVTAHECEAAAYVLQLADEAHLRQDVELVPAGLPSDDVVTAPR